MDVHIQPRASRNGLVGIHEGSLKVRLTAPPVEGKANEECIRYLAECFNIPKSRMEIMQGHKSRRKTILLRGIAPESIQEILRQSGMVW